VIKSFRFSNFTGVAPQAKVISSGNLEQKGVPAALLFFLLFFFALPQEFIFPHNIFFPLSARKKFLCQEKKMRREKKIVLSLSQFVFLASEYISLKRGSKRSRGLYVWKTILFATAKSVMLACLFFFRSFQFISHFLACCTIRRKKTS